MIIGVTGGSGFIGSWVQREAEVLGHTVLVLDHKQRGGMLGDVRDRTVVFEFAAHVDAIIHLAAILGTAETIEEPMPAVETNIIGAINVFEAASRYDLPVVFPAVGNSGIGRGTYAVTKTCVEDFVAMYREDRGLRITAVRPMNAYGPGQSVPAPYGSSKVRKIVPTLTCFALSGHPMPLYGGGKQVSDTVHVRDVAQVMVQAVLAASEGTVPEFPIDVGNVQPTTVRQVADQIASNIPGAVIDDLPMRPGEPEGGPLALPHAVNKVIATVLGAYPELNPIQVRRTLKRLGTAVFADTETLNAIGIDAATFKPLDEGIAETVAWYREAEGVTWHRR
jgi:UDP-glucose 4-epimerase